MPRFRATFLFQGRQHQRIIRGRDNYAVINTVTKSCPGASSLTIAPMPKDEKLKTYEVSIAIAKDPKIRRMRAANAFEVQARVEEMYRGAKILRIVQVSD